MTQTLRSAAALFTRLSAVYTNALELSHTATTHASRNSFLTGIDDVFCIMVHETDGGVERSRAKKWYDDYRRANGKGGGPQLVVWADGTVMSLVELPFRTTHGNNENGRAVGIETGHGNDGRYGDVDSAPDASATHTVRKGWHELSNLMEDVAGSASAKFFALDVQYNPPAVLPAGYPTFTNEVITASWTTNTYQTPAREPPGPLHPRMYWTLTHPPPPPPPQQPPPPPQPPPQPTLMIFTEWHYRSWALLTRYLCEALLVPRNFPVMPHARRDHGITDSGLFKKLVLADERFDMIVSGLSGAYHGTNLNFAAADFTGNTPADVANMRAHYGDRPAPPAHTGSHVAAGTFTFGAGTQNVDMNLAWLRFFDFYRGIHGHAFSGNQIVGQDDHDCPGPLFDWHRFAREVWDWWWLPFDFDAAHARTDVPDRPYRRANDDTPLVEYFFYDQPNFYVNRSTAPGGIGGAGSSPDTFMLEDQSPIYAMANGELVAARYPIGGDVSMAFALVRHEVFHLQDPGGILRQGGTPSANDSAHGGLADIDRIDYNFEPMTVYSLYMHLGRHADQNFGDVSDHNPDWLNRVLIRLAECDLALPPAAGGALHATLAPWAADFTVPPSNAGVRPTPLEAWRMDQARYRTFLNDLSAGNIAIAPHRVAADPTGPTPVRVILGDYLGVAGVIRRQGGASTHGIRVEVFSPTIPAAFFTVRLFQNNWSVPPGDANRVVPYQSEWARSPSTTESAALQAIGVDPANVPWWGTVAGAQQWDVRIPAASRLPLNGTVYHYRPLEFVQWINGLTWASEWTKYRVISAANPWGVRPAAPRNRRF